MQSSIEPNGPGDIVSAPSAWAAVQCHAPSPAVVNLKLAVACMCIPCVPYNRRRTVQRVCRNMSSLKLSALSVAALLAPTAEAAVRIEELSLEQLSDVVITSVSKREEALASAAASIYVITGE